jgi:hypothetical protein
LLLARSGTTTPLKALTLSDDGEDSEEGFRQKARRFDSPLARLFGKTSAMPIPTNDTRSEVDVLKGEIKEMRESQLRMEELLSKVLSASGK